MKQLSLLLIINLLINQLISLSIKAKFESERKKKFVSTNNSNEIEVDEELNNSKS